MSYLVAVVVVVGALSLLNLVLLLGVVRRLRTHTEILDALAGAPDVGPPAQPVLPAGAAVDEFDAVDVDGAPVSRGLFAGRTLAGFFSPYCEPCKEQLPRFVDLASAHGRDEVLAVVIGTDQDAAESVAALRPVARVVVERSEGPVARAFGVAGFPAFYLLDDAGTVTASGFEVEALAAVP